MKFKLTITSVVVDFIDFGSQEEAQEYAAAMQAELVKGRPARETTTITVELLPEPAEVTP